MCEGYCRRLFLQFTCPGDVRFARLGGGPPGKVRPKSLTCTPKQPQRPSRSTSAGQVNCRKCGRDRTAKGCIAVRAAKGCRMRVENVCGPAPAGGTRRHHDADAQLSGTEAQHPSQPVPTCNSISNLHLSEKKAIFAS